MNPTQADFATPSSQQQHLSHSRVALGLCGQGFIHNAGLENVQYV